MAELPSSLFVAVSSISAAQGPLHKKEFALLEGATPTRQRELIAGRVLARKALSEIGFGQAHVGQESTGAPIWPFGVRGSIAHSSRHVAVAVAHASCVHSVGIDIEDGRNLGAAASDIATEEELERLIAHPFATDDDSKVRLIFSAKEAVFKCQFPLTSYAELQFGDIRLEMMSDGLLRALPVDSLAASASAAIRPIRLLYQQIQGVTVAIAWA